MAEPDLKPDGRQSPSPLSPSRSARPSPRPGPGRGPAPLPLAVMTDEPVAGAVTDGPTLASELEGTSSGLDAHDLASGAKALAAAQVVNQLMRFATNVVLAHLLVPREFGIVAIALVVTALLDQFRDMGTGVAIIQRRDLSQDLLNAVFFVNAMLGVVLGLGLAVLAGPITSLVSNQGDPNILRAFAVVTFVTSLGQIHHALLRRDLRFRILAGVGVADTVITAGVSILLAVLGLGAWALVIGAMSGAVIDTGMVWYFDRWRPTRRLALRSLWSIAGFSAHLFGTNLVWFFSNQADKLLIGKFLGATPLGIYGMANRILTYPLGSIANVASEVTFPAFAKHQDDDSVLRSAYARVNAIVALVTFPLMAVLAAVARPAVNTVFGPKWEDLIPLIWILAPVGAIISVTQTSYQMLMAKGDTRLLFRFTVFSTAVVVLSYVIGLQWGLVGLCVCFAIATCLLAPVNLLIMFRKIGLGVGEYLRPIMPIAVSAVAAAGVILGFAAVVPLGDAELALVCQVAVGSAVFAVLMWLMHPRVLDDARLAIGRRRGASHTAG